MNHLFTYFYHKEFCRFISFYPLLFFLHPSCFLLQLLLAPKERAFEETVVIYLLLANRVSLETLHIPTAKHSVLSIAPSGFSLYLCSVIWNQLNFSH